MRVAAALLLCIAGSAAHAAYTAPLTRVRITDDLTEHTPSVTYARDDKRWASARADTTVYGAQYVGQWERASGWGLQLGILAARIDLQVRLAPTDRLPQLDLEGTGYAVGGQLRAYRLLWMGTHIEGERTHAISGFVNLRALYTEASHDQGRRRIEAFEARALGVSAGIGFMAELVLGAYVSVLPYAWFSPSLYQRNRFDAIDREPVNNDGGFSTRQPLRAGLDIWFYPLGHASDAHLALSTIASLIDTTNQGSNELSFVLGYTF